jgi:hypothetical protein
MVSGSLQKQQDVTPFQFLFDKLSFVKITTTRNPPVATLF